MSGFGRRRRTDAPDPAAGAVAAAGPAADGSLAFELPPPHYEALVRVIEHAHACLTLRSGSDAGTIRNAAGAELLPLLRPRADAARARGAGGVPVLVCEIRHLEAAVVNLESYGGHETVLCEGYALLERCVALRDSAHAARVVDGVLTLGRRTPPPAGR
ncbi:hypothetical protein GCM10010503_68660 [Streptomyces lucensis JCM 4490]|uniref:Uncharacterized protein n=1 Tax=Streptomyces lucensis JCM 4490 TaxID=1306176 RepID=A0A918JID7_9ACTN|nr:hypothetical protein [Streptomyces lucensis]GGW81628.1 hypothetical protein GCM10010503_68660 [Streptomyces lucensis JCM 4490]